MNEPFSIVFCMFTRGYSPKDGKLIGVCLKMVSTPLYPMVLLIIIPTKWLFHWGYTPFSDIPIGFDPSPCQFGSAISNPPCTWLRGVKGRDGTPRAFVKLDSCFEGTPSAIAIVVTPMEYHHYFYPVVNVYVTMERSTIFNGKFHYFYGHFQ